MFFTEAQQLFLVSCKEQKTTKDQRQISAGILEKGRLSPGYKAVILKNGWQDGVFWQKFNAKKQKLKIPPDFCSSEKL